MKENIPEDQARQIVLQADRRQRDI